MAETTTLHRPHPRKANAGLPRAVAGLALLSLIVLGLHAASGAEPVIVSFFAEPQVNDSVIHLGDIAGLQCSPALQKRLGRVVVGEAAPAGYSRFVAPSQVKEILRRVHGVAATVSSLDRVPVKTRCRVLKVEAFYDSIQAYFDRSVGWEKGHYSVSVDNPDREFKILDAGFSAGVGGLTSEYPRGPVRVVLSVRQGSRSRDIPIVCRVRVKTPVLVSSCTIARGETFGAQNCGVREMDITNCPYRSFASYDELASTVALRTITPGSIIHEKLLKKVPVVQKGDHVFVCISRGATRVSVGCRARENGGLGERIWVENLETHRLLRGIITGKATVELAKGESI